MTLPTRLDPFKSVHVATTGVDATDGDKVLIAAADVPASKMIVVMGYHANASAAQVFTFKGSGTGVLALLHMLDTTHLKEEAHSTKGMFVCPPGEGLTVGFGSAVAGSIVNATVEIVDVPA